MDTIQEALVSRHELLWSITEDAIEFLGPVRVVPSYVVIEVSEVGDPLSNDEAALAAPQRFLRLLAFDGVTDGPRYKLAVSLALDQVVLRPALQSLQRDLLVVLAAQHHDWCPGHSHPRPVHGLQAAGVGQRQVQQDHIEIRPIQAFEGFVEPSGLAHFEARGRAHLGEQYLTRRASPGLS